MPKPIDMQKRLVAHMEAVRKRDDWARKGLELEKAGKIEAAHKALKKAQGWDFKRRKLEL
jgi:hypothetical protein